MRYNYIVNYNGVLYPAGTDVPAGKESASSPSVKVEPKESKAEQTSTKEEPAPILQPNGKPYTRDIIRKMSADECKALAKRIGFKGASDLSATEVKRNLVMYLKL